MIDSLSMLHDVTQEERDLYLQGHGNRLIRYYYYLEQGLNILNEFRNLFLGIIALYIALHLTNFLWMALMFIPSIVALTIVGYFAVHRVAKVKEWVSLRFSTHYGIRSFDYQKGIYEKLDEIALLLRVEP